MKDQPKIRVLPDQNLGRDAAIGQVIEYEVDAQGAELRALVTWTEIASYRHSRTAQKTQWLPVDQTEQIDGQVYDGVTRTVVADQQPPGAPADAPQDWPAGVPAPSTPDWQKVAVNWLFEQLPPGYRSHQILRDHPMVLLQMARAHLRLIYTEILRGYRTAAVQLKDELPPHAIREVDETYREERLRIIRCGLAVDALDRAWQ